MKASPLKWKSLLRLIFAVAVNDYIFFFEFVKFLAS